jgi:hypothetical protein
VEPTRRFRPADHPGALEALRAEAGASELTVKTVGDCMAPLVPPGTLVQVRRRSVYWPGDVIAFASREGELTIHRLVGYRVRGRRLLAVTMADASPHPDSSVPFDRVLGRLTGGACDARAWRVPLADRLRAAGRFCLAIGRRLRP